MIKVKCENCGEEKEVIGMSVGIDEDGEFWDFHDCKEGGFFRSKDKKMITDSELFKGLMSENENLKELLEENKFDDLTAEQQLSVEAWEEDKQ